MAAGVLYVQGLELNVSTADWEPLRLGSVTRSFGGQVRSSVRATKREHRFHGDAQGVPVATAELYRALVEGEGHSWSFNDNSSPEALLASSRGLLPTSTGAVSDVTGRFGSGIEFDDGEPPTIWELGFDTSYCTLMFWIREPTAGGSLTSWRHYQAVFNGDFVPDTIWLNGVVAGSYSAVIYPDVDGRLVAPPSEVGTFQLDDLVILPYLVPAEWMAPIYSWRAEHEWAPLPYVTASGTAFPSGPVKALGQVGTAQRVPLWTGGTMVLGELLDFTLQE